ncbi:hypothetical protein JTB14_031901 [Gonioctena quinquepunctata]|nr:hypothetical protein JTB14_031901 [Gonioctena quinquepunctata]
MITKEDTNWRRAIPAKEGLLVTLRFLATSDSYHFMMYIFKISKQSISLIICEVCDALTEVLKVSKRLSGTPGSAPILGVVDGFAAQEQVPLSITTDRIFPIPVSQWRLVNTMAFRERRGTLDASGRSTVTSHELSANFTFSPFQIPFALSFAGGANDELI